MGLEVGQRVALVPGGVSTFTVVEAEVDGDPDLYMVEATGDDMPGKYPFLTRNPIPVE